LTPPLRLVVFFTKFFPFHVVRNGSPCFAGDPSSPSTTKARYCTLLLSFSRFHLRPIPLFHQTKPRARAQRYISPTLSVSPPPLSVYRPHPQCPLRVMSLDAFRVRSGSLFSQSTLFFSSVRALLSLEAIRSRSSASDFPHQSFFSFPLPRVLIRPLGSAFPPFVRSLFLLFRLILNHHIFGSIS